jgi:hypothetical protein
LARLATRLAFGSKGAAGPAGDEIRSDTEAVVGGAVAVVSAGIRFAGERGDMIVTARIARLTSPTQAARRGRVPDALSPGVRNSPLVIPRR